MCSIIYDITEFAEMLDAENEDKGRIEAEKKKIDMVLKEYSSNIYLYVSPRKYPAEFQIKDAIFPQGIFLHDFSNFYLVALAKIYLKIKTSKLFLLRVVSLLLESFFRFFITVSSKKNVLKSADYFYSKKKEMPYELRAFKNLKTISSLTDALEKNKDVLNIIFRMCDLVGASSASKRCFDISKNKLVKKTLLSLRTSVEHYKSSLKIYCVADNCSEDVISYFKNMFPDSELKEMQKGNATSFCECIELACQMPDGEQVYFLEDDYLMLNENVLNLLNFNLAKLSLEKGEKIAIMPDDYPDRYRNGFIQTECRITEKSHFVRIDKTTCTFATYTDVVKKHKKTFLKFIDWPRVTEEKSVNRVWKKVPLYQPIPAWTLHCQTKSVVPIYLNFEQIKNYFEG